MFTVHNPPDTMPLVGPLSWGLEAAAPRRVLYISGQVGADADGKVGDGFLTQAKLTWDNVGAVLRSAGMTPRNVIRTGIYVTPQVEMTESVRIAFNALRTGFLGDNRPASTMIYVHGLMNPEWLVEIDAVAIEL